MKKPPCKGCEKRTIGCHAKCEAYLNWKSATTEEREALRKYNDADGYRAENISARKK